MVLQQNGMIPIVSLAESNYTMLENLKNWFSLKEFCHGRKKADLKGKY